MATGETLQMIAERMPVIGFDSFDGLPTDWREGYPKGTFAQPPPEAPDGATIVHGWFNDTLPGFAWPDDVTLVHVDCDLYESTVTVLENIGHLLRPGVLVVFDEYHGYPGWENGEAKAWSEYALRNSITHETLAYGAEQLLVKIKD